ncbi:hypothetical protein [Symmachiella dynata]|uniref:Uncharacterized protein n=1 Tax=Symmachiella dynata TaxID=2527995 RepID=A0A517ZLR4_9PLAN|nr:hypothetical protein [Symmachiella dynata]QDT47807.1 hypothetical protein Pan258_18450 [Symmachiella dynata]QDU43407.1 hypothetical protein Mal52_18810 [Symmachiella dynata]|tara:strand:- start:120 stop:371 length:252 start_codon:yes stop_codon:yes gene_type:complete
MSIVQEPIRLLEEIADLLASNPTQDQLLAFRPSASVQERARELLIRLNAGTISTDEQRELDQFEQAEMLMRLVKARLAGQQQP